MTHVIVLTGPPGSGTEAVADLVARRVPRAAVIDVADLRSIVTVGRREPWEGDAVEQRNASRSPPFTSAQLRSLYESQRRLSEFDALLDTTNLNASEAADRVFSDLFE